MHLSLSLVGAALQYLEKFQGIKFQEPVWFKAGAVILNEPLNYLGQDNLVGARSIIATLAVQVSISSESLGHQPQLLWRTLLVECCIRQLYAISRTETLMSNGSIS